MEHILNAAQAKRIDNITIQKTGIPSMVLMERAALAVANEVEKHIRKSCRHKEKAKKPVRILAVCGSGNNGADAAAAARILYERGFVADIFILKGTGTEEYNNQISIAKASGVRVINRAKFDEYNIIIDGLFGIGLNRDLDSVYAGVTDNINKSGAWVIAVDIPSGINASDGKVMGAAVKADKTIAFGCVKLGSVLYPGTEYSGKVKIKDVGFPAKVREQIKNKAFTYTADDLRLIPKRNNYSNKGNYGRILVIAGSVNMGGAAVLSALSSYRNGAGIVKVLTHENQKNAVQKNIPEAIVEAYSDGVTKSGMNKLLKKCLSWATCVIAGPGLSTSDTAEWIIEYLLENSSVVTIFDADALNLIAADNELKTLLKNRAKASAPSTQNNISATAKFIITPHLGEMARLTGRSTAVIRENLIDTAAGFAKEYGVVCVMKDARTIVASPDKKIYINTSGNSGMATGGSGDVLTGVIAGMNAIGLDLFEAACMGVFLHGLGGDAAAQKRGRHGIKAGDIIDGITDIMAGNGD